MFFSSQDRIATNRPRLFLAVGFSFASQIVAQIAAQFVDRVATWSGLSLRGVTDHGGQCPRCAVRVSKGRAEAVRLIPQERVQALVSQCGFLKGLCEQIVFLWIF